MHNEASLSQKLHVAIEMPIKQQRGTTEFVYARRDKYKQLILPAGTHIAVYNLQKAF
jgi:hypothetical protein